MSIYKFMLVLASILSLWGCSNTRPNTAEALGTLERELRQRHGSLAQLELDAPEQQRRQRVDDLLSDTLSPARAMELLLINSPQVRAEMAGLGIAQAERLQAGLISNPTFALGALRPEGGGRWQLDAGLSQSILDLFTRPLRTGLAEAELAATQLQLYVRLNDQLYDAQHHYYHAVASRQRVQLQRGQLDAAQASYSLALSLYEAGNIPERSLLQYQLELQARERQLRQADSQAQQSQIALAGLLGIGTKTMIKLPTNLPALPVEDHFSNERLYRDALNQRSDLQLARAQLKTAEGNLALQQKTGRFTKIEMGANLERETDGSYMAGPEIALSLPIFDRGYARRFGANAAIAQSREILKAKEIEIETEIATALLALNSEREAAEQILTDSLPLMRQVQALNLREYNFMLGSAFDLLALKQAEFELQSAYVDALLNYWLARAELALASGTSLLPDAIKQANFAEEAQSEVIETEVDHSEHIDHSIHHHGGHHD